MDGSEATLTEEASAEALHHSTDLTDVDHNMAQLEVSSRLS